MDQVILACHILVAVPRNAPPASNIDAAATAAVGVAFVAMHLVAYSAQHSLAQRARRLRWQAATAEVRSCIAQANVHTVQVPAVPTNPSRDASSSCVPEEPRARREVHADDDVGRPLSLGDDGADTREPPCRGLGDGVHIRRERGALLLTQLPQLLYESCAARGEACHDLACSR